ncbi:MAG: transcription antitermination factor NusB [Bacteroidota bacterium]
MRRRIVREKVVQALYAYEIGGDPVEYVIKCVLTGLETNPTAHRFASRLVIETIAHTEDIDRVLGQHVTNWDFKRIAVLDRLILRMAICELMYFKEIPPKVSVNEAIELAKLFSTSRSSQFVNGILDAVLHDRKSPGSVPKSGRGLYEGDPRHTKKLPVKNN